MKEVAIFYRDRENPEAIKYLEDNFYDVLGGYIHITNYYTNEFEPGQQIDADVYILCYEESLIDLLGHIDDFTKVVVMKRNIKQQYLQPVIDLPAGTSVLVVNDSRESILQTMYMIYELGVSHIKLIPFEPLISQSNGYESIDTAIVTEMSEHLVPPYIKNVLNIHNRDVSFETFRKVISVLGLNNAHIHGSLLRKIRDELDTGADYINSFLSNFLKDSMLDNIINDSSRLIILVGKNDQVHFINEMAYGVFQIECGQTFPEKEILPARLLELKSFRDELIKFNGINYMAEKTDISLMDEHVGSYLILQNENDLREKESNMSRMLRQTGFYARYTFSDIIHRSAPMRTCIDMAKKAALSDYTILIRGESGTGKELLAQSIHNHSARKKYPFVAVNCAAIPENLLESELFGYEEGSFTGASKGGKPGLFEHAKHGTIFLDEIGDISPNLQTRLLRVIQEKQIMRVGSGKIVDIDARIIAATNADLEKKVANGDFREDLFFRLNVIPLSIVPLRHRKDDILPLLKVFLGRQFGLLSPADRRILMEYGWPGNVRELENAASYFRTMGQIPGYISGIRSGHIPDDGFSGADITCNGITPPPDSQKDSRDLRLAILSVIGRNSTPFSGIGRGVLMDKLAEEGLSVGEGILKRYLSEFKQEGLIYSSSGRSGSRLTEKGKEMLSRK